MRYEPLRAVPADAHHAARKAFQQETGEPVGLLSHPLFAAVDAAAKPIQDAVLQRMAKPKDGCLLLGVAMLALIAQFALYVAVALHSDGWIRVLALASLVVHGAAIIHGRVLGRRMRRKARAALETFTHAEVA